MEIQVVAGRRGKRNNRAASASTPTPTVERILRISRLMALAIKFEDMIARGEVRDRADLARLGYVTRARITQIMNLLHLAPDLQEEILFWNSASSRVVMGERQLRDIIAEVSWKDQRTRWHWKTCEGLSDRGI
jgi:hypothetical protein